MKMEDIPKLSTKDLEKYLDSETTEFDHRGRQYALEEYNRRKLKEISNPHWSVTPTFWLVLLSLIVALLGFLQQNEVLPKLAPATKAHEAKAEESKAESKNSAQANN